MTTAGLTEDQLSGLIHTFYARVREDPLIGPVFDGWISDWPEHLEKLKDFWSSVMLGSGRYKGKPLPQHIKLGDAISPVAFERWLSIWRQTTSDLLEARSAGLMQEKAERIAESLSLGISFHKDRHSLFAGGLAGSSQTPSQ